MMTKTQTATAGIFYFIGFAAIYHFVFDNPLVQSLLTGLLFAVGMVLVDILILEKLRKNRE